MPRLAICEPLLRYGRRAFQQSHRRLNWGDEMRAVIRAEVRYATRCARFTRTIRNLCLAWDFIDVVRHRGMNNLLRPLLLDGVHVNVRGMVKYLRSLRRQCIIQANKAREAQALSYY